MLTIYANGRDFFVEMAVGTFTCTRGKISSEVGERVKGKGTRST